MPEPVVDVGVVEEPIKPIKSSFTYDLDMLTYANYRELVVRRFGQTYDILELALTGWSFETPFEPGAMKKLLVSQSAAIFRTIMQAIKDDSDALSSTLKVDFDRGKWTMETVEKFITADEKNDITLISKMMLEVVRFPGIGKQPAADKLTAVQGLAAFKAIMDAWQRVMEGKN